MLRTIRTFIALLAALVPVACDAGGGTGGGQLDQAMLAEMQPERAAIVSRCVVGLRLSMDVCTCAARSFQTNGNYYSGLGDYLFTGKAPGGPNMNEAEGLAMMAQLERDIVTPCQTRAQQDAEYIQVWMTSCVADGNTRSACRCFYDDLARRVSDGGMLQFKRALVGDAGRFFGESWSGEIDPNDNFGLGMAIPQAMQWCDVKPRSY